MPIMTGSEPALQRTAAQKPHGMARPAKPDHGPRGGMKPAKHPAAPPGTQQAVTRVMKRGVRRHNILDEG